MKRANWGVVWQFATLGAPRRGLVVAHAFLPNASTPVCAPSVSGTPGPFVDVAHAERCTECLRAVMPVRVELAEVRSLRLWAWSLTSVASRLRGSSATRPAAEEAALAAAASLSAMAISVSFGENGAAADYARELVAEARSRRPSASATAPAPVAQAFRLAVTWDSVSGRAAARTETAPVVRRTPRLVFVERHSRTSAGGAVVVSTIALPREALERGEVVRGWSLREPSSEEVCAALAPFGAGQSVPSWASALGLAWPCSAVDAKRAFRRGARSAHPDAGGSSTEFQRLSAAYEAAEAFFDRGGS